MYCDIALQIQLNSMHTKLSEDWTTVELLNLLALNFTAIYTLLYQSRHLALLSSIEALDFIAN